MTSKLIEQAIHAVLTLGLISTASAAPAASTTQPTHTVGDIQGMEKCYGIAKAGMNDCGSGANNCAGEAKTNGDKSAWILVPTGTCHKIVGASLKPADKS